jgi:hypothetical protein
VRLTTGIGSSCRTAGQDDLFAKCELVACVSDIISDVTLAVAVAVANEFKSVEDRSKVMDAAARARDEFKGSEGE